MHRRRFLAITAGAGVMMQANHQTLALDARVPKAPASIAEIPTPALLLDLEAFEANLKKMAEHCWSAKCGFRPHAKTHKCPEIARLQIASGASGICVATVSEAEAMVDAGIRGVLLLVFQNRGSIKCELVSE